MANTLTLNSVHRIGNQQFQGLFGDVWQVTCTVTDHDAVAITDTFAMTITVPGVALGDIVICGGINMDHLDGGGDGAVIRFAVSAADTVAMYITADAAEFAADAITGAIGKILIGRPNW